MQIITIFLFLPFALSPIFLFVLSPIFPFVLSLSKGESTSVITSFTAFLPFALSLSKDEQASVIPVPSMSFPHPHCHSRAGRNPELP